MTEPTPSRLRRFLPILATTLISLPALDQLVTFVRVVCSRVSYPLDLEWMEGGVLYMSYRLLHGLPVYASPERGFLPFPYAPAHFALLAVVGKVVGLDYSTGRMLSLIAIAAVALALAIAVAREWADSVLQVPAAVIAVGWIAAGYPLVGASYDLIRIDPVAIAAVVLAASLSASRPTRPWRALLIALLLTFAIFTKQTMAAFAFWICLFVVVRDRKVGLALPALTALFCFVTLVALQLGTHGLFWFYTVTLLSRHGIVAARMVEGARFLGGFAPIVGIIPVAVGVLAYRRSLSASASLWLGMLLIGLVVSIVGYAKVTAWLNNLSYAAVLMGPVTILVSGAALRSLDGRREMAVVKWLFMVVVSGALMLRRYDGASMTVTKEMRARAQSLNDVVANLDGSVVDPTNPFLPVRNGRGTPAFHAMAYFDALGAGVPTPGLFEYLRLANAKYLISSECLWFPEYSQIVGRDVDRLYVFDRHLPSGARSIPMLTGFNCPAADILRLREYVTANPRVVPNSAPFGASRARRSGSPQPATAIAAGGTHPFGGHACSLAGGIVSCWGANDWGQAAPDSPDAALSSPTRAFAGATQVAVGGAHTCAVDAGGSVACWGDNREGALGDGSRNPRGGAVAVAVGGPLARVHAGPHHTCAIDGSARVICWGRNTSGQVGNGRGDSWVSPTVVLGVEDAVQLALGAEHTCALRRGGTVMCWGSGEAGQLGARTPGTDPESVTVAWDGRATTIAAGTEDTCVLTDAYKVFCWGGHMAERGRATELQFARGAVTLAMSGHHVCVNSTTGAVTCWGYYDDPGDDRRPWESVVPERLDVLANTEQVALGPQFGCALSRKNEVACWGRNERGQLGNGFQALFGSYSPMTVYSP